MKKGNEYLTKEQIPWSIKETKDQIEKLTNLSDQKISRPLRAIKLKELRLVLKIKLIQDRMLLEDKVRKTLDMKRIGGKFYPEQVCKVIGTTERQAVVIEKKALAKLKSPNLGRKLRSANFA